MLRPRTFAACLLLITTFSFSAEPPATQPSKVQPAAFPTFGTAFHLPAGWTEIPREKAGRIGQWIGPDSVPQKIKSLIMIETGPSGGSLPEVFAKGLARNFGGIVMDDPIKLGGEPAVKVRAQNNDDELAPTEGVVCVRGNSVYLVMGGTVKGHSIEGEIDAICKSWKWTAFEKPAAHLAFREKPFSAFDGSILLNAPTLMHENVSDDPDVQLDLAMFNARRNAADFRATMTLAALGDGETLEAARERFLADIKGKYKFVKAAPVWEPRKAATERFLTAMLEAERPQPAITDTSHHQWAFITLGEKNRNVVLIHFAHEAETDEERKLFEVAVEEMLKSVTRKAS